MPNQEWSEDHPKISAYISRELAAALSEWMKTNGHKKVSQALTVILQDYLLGPLVTEAVKGQDDRLEKLEAMVESLASRFSLPSTPSEESDELPKSASEQSCEICKTKGVGHTLMPSGYHLCPTHRKNTLNRIVRKEPHA